MAFDKNDLITFDRAICGAIWAGDAPARHLERLCMECNGRFAGSDDYRRAAALVADWWRAIGLSHVRLEPFPFTAWERGHADFSMVAPATRHYPCLALPYAPACDLEAEAIDLGFGLEADVHRVGDALRGKIALVKNGAPPGAKPEHRLQKYARVKAAGAAAFVFVDDQPGMLPPTGSLVFVPGEPLDQALPSVGIPYEVGCDLARWAAAGAPLRLRLKLENRLWPAESWNVIGDLPAVPDAAGAAPALIVGGHLDGHDIAQGAIDNASGIVAITEIARALCHGARPCVPTRFVAFGAEELGMLGSYAYVHQHSAELDALRFVFNLDCVGTGDRVGFALQDCHELAPLFRQMAGELATALEVSESLVPFSDQFPFTMQGIPSAFIHTSGDKAPRGWGHTAADTLDKVNVQAIRLAAAAVARLLVRVAATDPWPGRRRSAEEVKAMLQAQGVEPLLRAEKQWPFA
ncbi:MAG: M28 family metallopeptidase [Anaerolineae bacterium]|nr:M28 family metallopeptidase [Anaerolineae bacterium]